jgi:diadenosine tetraphosphate (Ap4A) HIT family hydrolase
MSFQIHPQILADCHLLGRFPHCHLLLHRNSQFPWFILVPETVIPDLLDLDDSERDSVMAEAAVIARFVRDYWQLPKINFAAIGNVVPQLHLHVVGRAPGDACWPKPVWGNVSSTSAYGEQDLNRIRTSLKELNSPRGLRIPLAGEPAGRSPRP